jgi:hypothetical protein
MYSMHACTHTYTTYGRASWGFWHRPRSTRRCVDASAHVRQVCLSAHARTCTFVQHRSRRTRRCLDSTAHFQQEHACMHACMCIHTFQNLFDVRLTRVHPHVPCNSSLTFSLAAVCVCFGGIGLCTYMWWMRVHKHILRAQSDLLEKAFSFQSFSPYTSDTSIYT